MQRKSKKRRPSTRKVYRKKEPKLEIKRHEILLSENNRLSYVYKVKTTGEIGEVTCVSYDIKINNSWFTIVFYDSSHGGIMHRHTRIVVGGEEEVVNDDEVKKKGTQRRLLTWAIGDIKTNYLSYKKRFLKRNRKYFEESNLEVDLF